MDRKKLLKSLNEAHVEYVIIGALAMPVHGFARVTVDIDIFIRPTLENAQKCLQALQNFGYDTETLVSQDLLEHKVLIRQYIVETDVHPFVTGVQFDEIWDDKVQGELEGVTVYFASLQGLIKMKKAAGRPKDLEDLKVLQKLSQK